MRANVQEVNDLNVFPIPDGNTGENMYLTLKGGVDELAALEVLPIAQKADVEVVALPQGLQNAVEILAEKQAFGELVALYVRKSSAEINLEKGA